VVWGSRGGNRAAAQAYLNGQGRCRLSKRAQTGRGARCITPDLLVEAPQGVETQVSGRQASVHGGAFCNCDCRWSPDDRSLFQMAAIQPLLVSMRTGSLSRQRAVNVRRPIVLPGELVDLV
jgi:hypothetical protein